MSKLRGFFAPLRMASIFLHSPNLVLYLHDKAHFSTFTMAKER